MLISPLSMPTMDASLFQGDFAGAAKWFRPEAGKKARNALARERLDHSSGFVSRTSPKRQEKVAFGLRSLS
jgi:hypothetical protein